ncbi:MAG: hypothetical protein EXQ85_05755 [Alphaproteobacteria bacterium]|nr:hypothetical protein [Alphaproteobacteria bacterium]
MALNNFLVATADPESSNGPTFLFTQIPLTIQDIEEVFFLLVHAPVAGDDAVSLSEDAGSVSGNVLANDTDADGDALVVMSSGSYTGSYGTLSRSPDGSFTITCGRQRLTICRSVRA